MEIQDIKLLSYNSFFSSNLIAYFLSGCQNNQIKFELIFLVLPFVYHKDSRDILIKANVTSTLYSKFLDDTNGRIALANLEKRYLYFKELTQKSIIVSANKYQLEIKDYIQINNPVRYQDETDLYIASFYKASHYLGVMMSKADYLDVFIRLGIKEVL